MAETTEREKGGKEEEGEGRKVKGRNTESVGAEAAKIKRRDWAKERRDTLKEYGLCGRCKQDPGYHTDGRRRRYCKPCVKHINSGRYRRTKKGIKTHRARVRKQYYKRQDEGICTKCANEPLLTVSLGKKCLDALALRFPRTSNRQCTLCRGEENFKPHNSRNCPRRFRVSVDEFATSRPGSDHPDSAMSM
ncbi:MAG TPA: hypothetical protein VFM05_01585, partial [Candidatus Saccharimonadales bacterium]|nr:hypothetical protein [Candidatus Saccharimonadales bacterium]